MKRHRLRPEVLGPALLFVSLSFAQQPIPIEKWEDFETWPVVKPGELKFDNGGLKDQRIVFDGLFPGPGGLRPTMLLMDVTNVYFRGEPAVWIQWTSTAQAGGADRTASMDMVVVDKRTFRALFRVAGGPGKRQWAGNYHVVHYGPDEIANIAVRDDGSTETKVEAEADVFEFATFQFLFPFIQLREGARYRLPGFQRIGHRNQIIPVLVGAPTEIPDAHGNRHEVWPVQVISADRGTLITFFVSKEAPFFFGWKYERVKDGTILTSLTFRDWTSLD